MKKPILLMSLALLMISISSATTISKETVTVDLENQTVNATLNVKDLTTESFNYQTSHPVEELRVKINNEEVNCSLTELAVGATINCPTDLKQNFNVSVAYKTNNLVSRQDKINVFRYSQSIYRPISNYTFTVILPEGTGVIDQNDATTDVISPSNGVVGNMDGRRFFVRWETNPELSEPESFRVLFEPFERNVGPESSLPWLALLTVVVAIGVIYLLMRRRDFLDSKNMIEELTEDEKMVVEMLRSSENEMLQKDIVEDSDYSKAKISGVVSELVDKDIVSKEKEGRSNKVSLNERFRV